MPSLFSEPAEFPWTAPLTGEEGLCADDPCVNSTLLCAPTGDSTLEATVGDNQGRATLHHSDEASLPLHLHNSHAEMEASLACLQFGSQPNLQTYEVIVTRLSLIRVQTNVPQTWPHGARGHVTIQAAQGHDSGNMRRRVQTVCIDCNKGFRRAQELARHRKDVHEQPRHCLFCGFKWTRPNSIKVHLLARHRGKFTAELLITIQALRGRMIVAFLDGYDQDSGGVEVAFHSPVS